jgi:hypothetical protein
MTQELFPLRAAVYDEGFDNVAEALETISDEQLLHDADPPCRSSESDTSLC